VATLIEGRDQKKRPTEFGMNQVIQPFDGGKFNFTKVRPEEVIFRFQETEDESAWYFDGAPHTVSASPSSILINVSVFPSLAVTSTCGGMVADCSFRDLSHR
jgi:GDP-L-galactose phosphorylase